MRAKVRFGIDPGTIVVAVVAGAATWAMGGGVWALAVGAAALATGVVAEEAGIRLARYNALPPAGSPERLLVVRARSAVETAHRLARSAPKGPVVERVRAAELQLELSAKDIALLARQSVEVRRLARGIDDSAAGRLHRLTEEFGQRAESLVGSLENVVAGLIEVLATAEVDPSGDAVTALERLGAEVEALRAGLEEARGLGRQMELNDISEVTT